MELLDISTNNDLDEIRKDIIEYLGEIIRHAFDRKYILTKQLAEAKLRRASFDIVEKDLKNIEYILESIKIGCENSNLKDQLFGKAAKIAEGAKVGQEFSVKSIAKSDTNLGDLAFTAKWDGNGSVLWINGPDIEVYNFSKDAVTLSFFTSGQVGDVFYTPSSVTLQPSETKFVKIATKPNVISDKPPRSANQGDVTYTAALTVKSKTSSATLSATFKKIGFV